MHIGLYLESWLLCGAVRFVKIQFGEFHSSNCMGLTHQPHHSVIYGQSHQKAFKVTVSF